MRLFFASCFFSLLLLLVGCTSQSVTSESDDSSSNSTSESDESSPATEVEVPDSLVVGDIAPPIHAAKYVTGSGVEQFESGTVYVVEFWATWCPPCRDSMPHLSDLQAEYGGKVKFIGFTKEDEATVTEWLDGPAQGDESKTWREVAQYALALDDSELTSNSYMTASKQRGIPTAFIVGAEGHLEWIGHPMAIDRPLEKIAAGDWDRVAAAKAAELKQTMMQAWRAGELDTALTALNEQVALDPGDIDLLTMKSRLLSETGEYDQALECIDKVIAAEPDEFAPKLDKFNILASAERSDDANRFAKEVSESSWDDAEALNGLSWAMAAEVPTSVKDLDLAKELAVRAVELTEENDASILDTLARVEYELGDLEQAIEWQQKAVGVSPGKHLQNKLEGYEAELELNNANAAADSESAESSDSEDAEAEESISAGETEE